MADARPEPAGSRPADVPVLRVSNVTVRAAGRSLIRPVLNQVSLDIRPGEIAGLVGESGSGKTTLCRLVAGLLLERMKLTSGSITLGGRDVTTLPPRALHQMLPRGLSMVFQDPLAALNPVMRIGDQVAEAVTMRHEGSRADARRAAIELLRQMGLDDAERRARDYPRQLSGGQRQRVVIAMALATDPVLLLADEPTSALDVRTQAQILDLLKEVAATRQVAILLVSHDFGVISEICSKVWVMYAGEIVESGTTAQILRNSAHPYTARLITSLPSVSHRVPRLPVIAGQPPTLEEQHPGCPFYPRCERGQAGVCTTGFMSLQQVGPGHATACVLAAVPATASESERPADPSR
ncbi:MAG: ABC transporter ATP-binding protein [Streptosporangiaceae bacterium]